MSARTTCLVLGSIGCLAFPWSQAPGQVATDGTVGPRRELSGPDFQIGAELGSRAGGNLFHSFERFSIETGGSATFTGPNDVRNVISRVTGGAPSDIDGTLASTIPGADFYFINPAGILFGPNASLDVQGSFHVSTADEVRFADGEIFSADLDARSSFTVARPDAFGFLGGDRGALSVTDSQLQVLPGEAISLVGRELTIAGGSADIDNPTIGASRGTITVGAVGIEGGQLAIRSGRLEASERGPITLTNGAFLDTTGDGGGVIRIEGGRLVVDNSFVFANNNGSSDATGGIEIEADRVTLRNGSIVTADALASGHGGEVRVDATRVTLRNDSIVRADALASGHGGEVRVDATRVAIRSSSFFASDVRVGGNGGSVNVEADRILIAGDGAAGFTGMGTDVLSGAGQGGETIVHAGNLRVLDGGQISASTRGEGKAGAVKVRAGELVIRGGEISSSAEDFSTGNAGTVKVRAGALKIRDGGVISSGTKAKGRGGTVIVEAERLVVSGDGANALTGITSQADTGSTGNAGAVQVRAGELEIRDGGVIVSGTFASGNAGTVKVQAERLHIVGGGDSEFSTGISTGTDFGRGPTGEVLLSTGNAGAVKVRAGELEIRDGGVISSDSLGSGNAGTVTVQAERLLHIDGAGGKLLTGISTSAVLVVSDGILVAGQGNAGAVNVIVTAGNLEIRDGGKISSFAIGGGDAGKVTVEADRLVLDRASITAFSASAGGGEIQLMVGELIDLHDSVVTTSVIGGADNTAGSIGIGSSILVIDGGSQVQANASDGEGGLVRIVADNIVVAGGDFDALLEREDISATGGTPERDGTVAVNAPEINLAGDLVILDAPLVDAAALLGEPCGARRDVGASSFIAAGRGGLPASPDAPLPGAYRIGPAAAGAGAGQGGARASATAQPAMLRLAGCAGAP